MTFLYRAPARTLLREAATTITKDVILFPLTLLRTTPWRRFAEWIVPCLWLLLCVAIGLHYAHCWLFNYCLRRQQRLFPGAILLQRRRQPQVIPLIHRILQQATSWLLVAAEWLLIYGSMSVVRVIAATRLCWRMTRTGWTWTRNALHPLIQRVRDKMLPMLFQRRQQQQSQGYEPTAAAMNTPPPPAPVTPSATTSATEAVASPTTATRRVAFGAADDGTVRETVIIFDVNDPSTQMSLPQERLRPAMTATTPSRQSRRVVRRVQTPPAKVRPSRNMTTTMEGAGHGVNSNSNGGTVDHERQPTATPPQRNSTGGGLALKHSPAPAVLPTTPTVSVAAHSCSTPGSAKQQSNNQDEPETVMERLARKRAASSPGQSNQQQQQQRPTPPAQAPPKRRRRSPLGVRQQPPQGPLQMQETEARKREKQQRKEDVWNQFHKRIKSSNDGDLGSNNVGASRQQLGTGPVAATIAPSANSFGPPTLTTTPAATSTPTMASQQSSTTTPAAMAPQPAFTFGSTAETTPAVGPVTTTPQSVAASGANNGTPAPATLLTNQFGFASTTMPKNTTFTLNNPSLSAPTTNTGTTAAPPSFASLGQTAASGAPSSIAQFGSEQTVLATATGNANQVEATQTFGTKGAPSAGNSTPAFSFGAAPSSTSTPSTGRSGHGFESAPTNGLAPAFPTDSAGLSTQPFKSAVSTASNPNGPSTNAPFMFGGATGNLSSSGTTATTVVPSASSTFGMGTAATAPAVASTVSVFGSSTALSSEANANAGPAFGSSSTPKSNAGGPFANPLQTATGATHPTFGTSTTPSGQPNTAATTPSAVPANATMFGSQGAAAPFKSAASTTPVFGMQAPAQNHGLGATGMAAASPFGAIPFGVTATPTAGVGGVSTIRSTSRGNLALQKKKRIGGRR